MPRQYFTLDEANALLPRLDLAFGQMMRVRAQLKQIYRDLEQLGHPPTVENLHDDATAAPEVRRSRGLFKALVETLSEELARVESLGAEVKDVEVGLVDFWSTRDGSDVLLCWQYGEKAIAYFHAPDSGFAGRRPLVPQALSDRTLH